MEPSGHRPFQIRVAFPTLRPPRVRLLWGPAPWTKRGKRTTCDALVEGCGSRFRRVRLLHGVDGAGERFPRFVHGRDPPDSQAAEGRCSLGSGCPNEVFRNLNQSGFFVAPGWPTSPIDASGRRRSPFPGTTARVPASRRLGFPASPALARRRSGGRLRRRC